MLCEDADDTAFVGGILMRPLTIEEFIRRQVPSLVSYEEIASRVQVGFGIECTPHEAAAIIQQAAVRAPVVAYGVHYYDAEVVSFVADKLRELVPV